MPGSGAGPSPDRMVIGSEGILGVITEAWMRLQDRPAHRGSAAVHFADYTSAVEAVRMLSQSGLYPSNCRLIDAQETGDAGAGDGSTSLLVLGFESADHPRRRLDEAGARTDRGLRRRSQRLRRPLAPRRGGRRLARRLHQGAVLPRGRRAPGCDRRHLRDRRHLGPLRRLPRPHHRSKPPRSSSRRRAGRGASPAASPTSTPTGRRRTSRSPRSATGSGWPTSGARSSSQPTKRWSKQAAR